MIRPSRLPFLTTIVLVASTVAACSTGPALTQQDTVLVADVVNKTGDPGFDDALKPAIVLALQQTPFLTILPDPRVQRTLRAMQRTPDVAVTGELARELCQRSGTAAVIEPTIDASGTQFVLTLVANNCKAGSQIAKAEGQAATKSDVLKQLAGVVKRLRQDLGEPAATLASHDAPQGGATSSSLEALQAYGQGLRVRATRGDDAAVAFFQQAITRDPRFAMAYAKLGIVTGNVGRTDEARAATQKAYELRDGMSQYERLYIQWNYASRVMADQKAVKDALVELTTMYPRDFAARNNFGVYYNNNGEFEEALKQYQAASEIAPDEPGPISNSAYVLLLLGRYDEASDAIDRALAIRPEPNLAVTRWVTARVMNLPRAAEFEKVARSLATPDQAALADASLAAWFGRFTEFAKLQDNLIATAKATGRTDLADAVAIGRMITLAAYRRGSDLTAVKAAAAREKNPAFLAQQISALAMLGEIDAVRAGLKKLDADPAKEAAAGPSVTVARAYVQAKDGKTAAGIAAIEAALKDAPRSRDLLYFIADLREQTGDLDGAIAGYRRVIDSFTYLGPNPLIPAARLKLAKILMARKDSAGAKAQLDALLTQWKGAEGEFAALTEAKQLSAQLK